MPGECLILSEDEVTRFLEVNCPNSAELQRLTAVDLREPGLDRFGINFVRSFAGQSEQDGAVGAVTLTSKRE